MASATKVQGLTIAASIALHAGIAGWISWVALRSLSAPGASAPLASGPAAAPGGSDGEQVAVELPSVGEGTFVEERAPNPEGAPPRVASGDEVAHIDTTRAGHGGQARSPLPALNLADRDERLRLSPDPVSHLERDQIQRLRVSRDRQSWEDRRSTTHPTELTLLVSGAGRVFERRAPSELEPSRGVRESSPASALGGRPTPSSGAAPAVDATAQRPAAASGSSESAPGTGLVDARTGVDHHAAAPIASARPDVARAPVAVPALDPARPRDDVDSDQEVATLVRSLVHASTAGGLSGEGQGGSATAGDVGVGGAVGPGSRARPLGLGEGDVFDYWTSDPRLLPYFRRIHAKIDPLWADAFPRSALLDLKQGTVIIEFTIAADGRVTVSWPPYRPSGVDEFDRNCAEALRRASPLPPLPRELGVTSLRVRAPFVVSNPVVK